tara:strand:+ start:629 stop:919 length:291 start_codon:yes stop_codon:yes gene_type:complete
MDVSKDAAISIIGGQLDNFRGALFKFSSGETPKADVEEFVHAKRFFFREASGFSELADMAQLSVSAVREQLRKEETVCLEEAGLGEVNFASLVASE